MIDSIAFAWPWMAALMAVPLLWLFVAPVSPLRPALSIPRGHPAEHLTSTISSSSLRMLILPMAAWCLLCLGAMRPQNIGEPVDIDHDPRMIVLAIDISLSMEQHASIGPFGPTRLEALQEVAATFVRNRPNDLIALVVFGSHPYPVVPLTHDREALADIILSLKPGLAGPSTAIGDAVGASLGLLPDDARGNSAIILVTDGHNNSGITTPIEAARRAAGFETRIHAIGFRGRSIFPTPVDLDEGSMKGMAELTGGTFHVVNDTSSLEQVYRRIDELETVDHVLEEQLRPITELYAWPVGLGLIIVALSLLLPSVLRWIPARA